jgi:enoyl-CoA hydratase/carnithine racemase
VAAVEVVREGPSARLTLPGGPLDRRAAAALAGAAASLAEDADLRVVVLGAAGPDFCTGPAADLDPLALGVDPADALAALRPPVIVALGGVVASVGLEVALAGDLRLAADDATFALPDVAAGRLPSWGGTQRLPRAIGRPRALAMLLAGEVLDADAALAAGLVHEVVPRSGLAARADELATALAGLAPLALELAKEAVHRGSELPLRDALRLEGDFNHLLQGSADRAEGLAAFFEKRTPTFRGR